MKELVLRGGHRVALIGPEDDALRVQEIDGDTFLLHPSEVVFASYCDNTADAVAEVVQGGGYISIWLGCMEDTMRTQHRTVSISRPDAEAINQMFMLLGWLVSFSIKFNGVYLNGVPRG